ncbi:MAG: glycoside hydrolase family 3 N-terminal domain-containing protein, partial [Acidimicrobiia bacterium]
TAMAELGVNMALAPVVDVGAGPGIGTRAYSESPEVVAAYAGAVAEGFLSADVIPMLKHFPGHGRASGDSHESLPNTPPLSELSGSDLLPFRDLLVIEGTAVLVGHLAVPGLTDGLPASVSPEAIDGLLRGDMGFDGLVMTDSLAMGAMASFGEIEAARLALLAGADIIIVSGPAQVPVLIEALQGSIAAGTLSWDVIDDSVERILDAKDIDPCTLG